MELPPRTRRIRDPHQRTPRTHGTTSAYAENTPSPHQSGKRRWNYLRVRGEYKRTGRITICSWELPPRTRRIRVEPFQLSDNHGTTSACAENTDGGARTTGEFRNYLRVRGEYLLYEPVGDTSEELPPRARRILHIIYMNFVVFGTTSACAENTRTSTPETP